MCCPLEAIQPSPTQVYLHVGSNHYFHLTIFIFVIRTFKDWKRAFEKNVWIVLLYFLFIFLYLYCNRQSTETSASSSSRWVQTGRIRPSVSAWANTKVARVLWWGHRRRAMSLLKPREWWASFRSSSGTSTWNTFEILKTSLHAHFNLCIQAHCCFAVRTTAYSVYCPETYEGHWKQLTVRTTRTKEAMAVVFFNPQVMKCSQFSVRGFIFICHWPLFNQT